MVEYIPKWIGELTKDQLSELKGHREYTQLDHFSDKAEGYGLNPPQLHALLDAAFISTSRAHAPYSSFCVGSAVFCQAEKDIEAYDFRFYGGCNVENAAYPVGLCAERNALSTAVMGGDQHNIRAIAVAVKTPDSSEADVAPYPCGMCRQFIAELVDPRVPVFVISSNLNITVKRFEELLPDSFGPKNLPT